VNIEETRYLKLSVKYFFEISNKKKIFEL
jgi:hypothetical protein